MKKTVFAVAAVVMFALAGAAAEPSLSSAQDIARFESGGALARDPEEKPVDAPKDMKLVLCMGQSNMAGRAKMSDADREVGEGDIPVIAGEIGRWMRPDGDHAARINPGIGKIPSLLPRSAVVSSEGLANQDRHHFDREGQRILGGRYYDAFKSL